MSEMEEQDCPNCTGGWFNGGGEVTCPRCAGCGHLRWPHGEGRCNQCQGTGKITCNRCGGTGNIHTESRRQDDDYDDAAYSSEPEQSNYGPSHEEHQRLGDELIELKAEKRAREIIEAERKKEEDKKIKAKLKKQKHMNLQSGQR